MTFGDQLSLCTCTVCIPVVELTSESLELPRLVSSPAPGTDFADPFLYKPNNNASLKNAPQILLLGKEGVASGGFLV